MGKVVDGIAQPLLPRQRIHMEAEEEEEQTHGRLELPRLFLSFGQEVLTKALKTRVDRVVSPDADIGAVWQDDLHVARIGPHPTYRHPSSRPRWEPKNIQLLSSMATEVV